MGCIVTHRCELSLEWFSEPPTSLELVRPVHYLPYLPCRLCLCVCACVCPTQPVWSFFFLYQSTHLLHIIVPPSVCGWLSVVLVPPSCFFLSCPFASCFTNQYILLPPTPPPAVEVLLSNPSPIIPRCRILLS